MGETSNFPDSRRSSFDGNEPRRKKSKVSDLVSQVIGTQEVITSRTTNYFAKLPHEVIINIFKYLDFTTISKCALLCRGFWVASQDGILYQKVSLKYTLHPKHLESYVSKISCPRKLKIEYKVYNKGSIPEDYAHFNSQIIKLLKKCGEHLISLQIESCRSEDVLLLLSECKNLRKLQLSRCKSSFRTLPDLRNLVDIKFSLNDIPTSILGELFKNNKNLRSISLSDTTNLQTSTVADVIGNHNTELEKLHICEKRKVKAKGLRSIARCSKLRVLELTGDPCYSDPEDSLQQLAAGCPWLEKLVIYGWKSVTDSSLEPFLQTCTQLKILELGLIGITIRSCREAALSLPFLKTLNIRKCKNVEEVQFMKLKKEFPEVDMTLY